MFELTHALYILKVLILFYICMIVDVLFPVTSLKLIKGILQERSDEQMAKKNIKQEWIIFGS